MRFGRKKVNINNYLEIFKDYSKDVKEVIRGAILDDTPIAPYIDRYRNDPYMLWQVKMAMDEGLDNEWFDIVGSGRVLSNLRELFRRGINIEPLKNYFSKGLSERHYEYIVKWYGEGFALNKYNFEILQDELLDTYDYGISLGYPMYIFNNGVYFTRKYILCCLKIISNGKSVVRFLDGTWNIENLELLSKYSKSKYYGKLVRYVTKDITPTVLEELYSCAKVGMSLNEVSIIDGEGVYLYSGVHISLIREAYLNNWDYSVLLNPDLSINKINNILDELKYTSKKKVSGRLRKN